jgi:hypothetical protein
MFLARTVHNSVNRLRVGGINAVDGGVTEQRGTLLPGMDLTLEQWDAVAARLHPDARPSVRGAWSPAIEAEVIRGRRRVNGVLSTVERFGGGPRNRRRVGKN